jgi:glycosyltransferase involved in cell wall biosynthesis
MRDVLRGWDRRTAARPDILVANSTVVQRRIEALWGRPARIIFPPVRVEEFTVSPQDDGFFLTAARMLSYRRLDLVVEACSRLGRPLVLVGKGPEEKSLRRIAGSSVIFKPRISRSELIDLMSRCSGYIVPGTEDFGIAPVEAMAAGKPVIAYRAGGAVDTVVEGVTGLFFDEPSSESLADAIDRFDKVPFDRLAIRRHAEEFAPDVFRQRWRDLLAENGIKV